MIITRTDPFTGKTNKRDLDVTIEQLNEYASPGGRLIQNIMPDLTPDEREFIMTGIMPDSWLGDGEMIGEDKAS